jgi:hypothetical protein
MDDSWKTYTQIAIDRKGTRKGISQWIDRRIASGVHVERIMIGHTWLVKVSDVADWKPQPHTKRGRVI